MIVMSWRVRVEHVETFFFLFSKEKKISEPLFVPQQGNEHVTAATDLTAISESINK